MSILKEKKPEEDLKEQLQTVKARASSLSGDVTRLSKELGSARHDLEAKAALEAEVEDLKGQLADTKALLSASESALKTATNLAATAEATINHAKAIVDGLDALKKL